ncbi:extracellular solute-binding protein [Liberiplasma polymorphum]|uniref:extracellular solute-binding protein n=1 Tax=Liberiplasma polymorphum TaxID=3374570 RepID=UPI003775B768
MKKIMIVIALALFTFSLAGCGAKERLYVLNWGDYMDLDLVREFEKEHNVRVVYETVGSNEEMELKIKQRITNYDIVIPSDYMIDKLHQEGLLNPIDKDLLPNYAEINFFEDARNLYENETFGDYMIPYFFGTIGIMFNTSKPEVRAALEAGGICTLFDENSPFNIGMYDSPRDAVGAALLCLGYSVNTTDETELLAAENLLRNANFLRFGEDDLKGDVALGSLDMALVYSGDYFEMLFLYEEEDEVVNFDFYNPIHTNIWIDAFVIPTTSQNIELAHAFINFFLDIEVAAENADWVGYTPVIVEVYDVMIEEYEYDYEHYYPQPVGSTREAYRYISETHSNTLNQILNRAKLG